MDYECPSCGRTFGIRSPIARFSLCILGLIVIGIIAAVAAALGLW